MGFAKAMDAYRVWIVWSEEDDGYIASVPDWPGCSAYGPTRRDAVKALEDAAFDWVDAQTAVGNPIPKAVNG